MTKPEDESTVLNATCGNCRFSVPARGPKGEIDFKTRWCRRNPPTPIIVPGPQGPVVKALWPTLHVTDACFSHEFAGNASLLPGEASIAASEAKLMARLRVVGSRQNLILVPVMLVAIGGIVIGIGLGHYQPLLHRWQWAYLAFLGYCAICAGYCLLRDQ